MYNNKCNCGCGNNAMAGNMCNPAPVVAPKKVCVSQSNCYVEQPVICPIECRHVRNLVYYPRYYPRYEQTCMTRDPNGNIVSASGMPFNGTNMAGMSAYGMDGNGFANNCGNSFKHGYGK